MTGVRSSSSSHNDYAHVGLDDNLGVGRPAWPAECSAPRAWDAGVLGLRRWWVPAAPVCTVGGAVEDESFVLLDESQAGNMSTRPEVTDTSIVESSLFIVVILQLQQSCLIPSVDHNIGGPGCHRPGVRRCPQVGVAPVGVDFAVAAVRVDHDEGHGSGSL